MKKFVVMVAALAAFYGCAGGQKSECNNNNSEAKEITEAPKAENAESSLTYLGVYEGTLPAASSPGIKTKLTLNKDMSCTLHSEYIDEKDGVFDNKGTYTAEGDILTVKQDDGTVYYYKVEEGQIRMLNGEKQEITGELADNYILKQTEKF